MRVMIAVPHTLTLMLSGADRKKNDRRMGTTVVNDNYLFELGG